jgi:hypothetical protein
MHKAEHVLFCRIDKLSPGKLSCPSSPSYFLPEPEFQPMLFAS